VRLYLSELNVVEVCSRRNYVQKWVIEFFIVNNGRM
jgi:hypothetical protein